MMGDRRGGEPQEDEYTGLASEETRKAELERGCARGGRPYWTVPSDCYGTVTFCNTSVTRPYPKPD